MKNKTDIEFMIEFNEGINAIREEKKRLLRKHIIKSMIELSKRIDVMQGEKDLLFQRRMIVGIARSIVVTTIILGALVLWVSLSRL